MFDVPVGLSLSCYHTILIFVFAAGLIFLHNVAHRQSKILYNTFLAKACLTQNMLASESTLTSILQVWPMHYAHQTDMLCREVQQLTPSLKSIVEPDVHADITCRVPSVSHLLSRKSKSAVRSCSKQCHSPMQHLSIAVMVSTLDDFTAISSSPWSSLGVVVNKKQSCTLAARDTVAQRKQQILVVFGLHNMYDDDHVVLTLKPTTDQYCQVVGITRQVESLANRASLERLGHPQTMPCGRENSICPEIESA